MQEGGFSLLYRETAISPQVEYYCDPWNKLRYKDGEFGNLYALEDSVMVEDHKDAIWIMYFDRACCKIRFGAGIVLASPTKHYWHF